MLARYRVKVPIPAILVTPEHGETSVTLPVGALLKSSLRSTTTLMGMVGVYWEGRHYYTVSISDLLSKTERVETA